MWADLPATNSESKTNRGTIDFIQDLIPNVFGQTNPGGASDDV